MLVIAVAGGTGSGLGRAIVTGLIANPDHKVIVLSRSSSTAPKWIEELGVEIRKVDYESGQSLQDALKGVHTVLSTLLATDGTWASTQIRLLKAGLAVGITRFAPADWGIGPKSTPLIEMLSPQEQVWDECKKTAAEHPGRFEWAAFHLGLFMNYLGLGCPNKDALAGLQDEYKFIWDVENMHAEIPLTEKGDIPRITLTELRDVGKYVSFACDLPFGQWKQDMGMAGDTRTMDEVVTIIEKVRGRKMEIAYRPLEKISNERKAASDPVKKFWLELEEAYARDRDDEGFFATPLNDMAEGQVKPLSVDDYVKKYWGGV